MKKIKKLNNGFTLLFAVVVAGMVLVAALGVYNIMLKEFKLSGFIKESQMAFYAADSGAECVFYWDIKMRAISTTTTSNINCLNQTKSVGGALVSSFNLTFDNGTCSTIIIDKTNFPITIVKSYGYNTCDTSSSGRVERAVKTTY